MTRKRMLMIGSLAVAAWTCAAAQTTARSSAAQAKTAPANATLSVSGHAGTIPVVQINGRTYVDVEALARLTQGSIAYRQNGVVLTLAAPATSDAAVQPAKPKRGFSQGFLNASIEAMSVVREWRSALVTAVQNNYPINDDWVSQYRRTADNRLALASAAANTDADHQAYPLLANELANMTKQSDRFLAMRRNLQFIATYSLDQDALDQQILNCSRGVSALFSSGQFEDVPSCH